MPIINRSSIIVAIILCTFLLLGFVERRKSQAQTNQLRQPIAPESVQVCDPEIGSDIGTVTFERARQIFLNQKLSICSERKDVRQSSDLIGSIAVYGKLGKWIYITYAELWYDPIREISVYAQLRGIVHNGEVISFDVRDQLPEGFAPIKDWGELGNVVLKDIDDKMHRVKSLAFEVASDGSLMNKSAVLSRQSPEGSWVPADFGVQCNPRATVECFGFFCLGRCTKRPSGNGEDCHCNYYAGVCTTSPGLACGGNCDPGYTCKLSTPNPGSLGCACRHPFSDQRPNESSEGCDPYVNSSCECVDDYGNVDSECLNQVRNLPSR